MGILILEEGKHGVTTTALVHGVDRINHVLKILYRIRSLKLANQQSAEKVRLKIALRALVEAKEMVELGITLIESDLK